MRNHGSVLVTLIFTLFTSHALGFTDICKTNYLTLPIGRDEGFLGITSSSKPSENGPCILRLSGCSQCRIAIYPVGDEWTFPYCSSQLPSQYSLKECIPGCSYMFVFDSLYLNETLRFYRTSNWQRGQFKSISSAVFVGLCSNPNPPNITLKYNIESNNEVLTSSFGHVRSPNFPNGYHQNGDVYTWVIRNKEFSRILVVFDDWHISPFTGEVYFDESDRRRPINGSMGRPIVISKGPEMKVTFSTGNHFLGDQSRYMGFKFTYTFYRAEDSIPSLSTDCGKSYLINEGGMIDFQLSSSIEGYQYDCTWLIKRQPDFDKVYMKIIKFRTDDLLSYSNQEVEIRDGVTSDGEVLDKITARRSYGKPFFSTTGFYIRFRGRVRPMDNLQIVFTSFRERGASDCNSRGMFYCNTGRCIPAELKCDRFNHCEDNSDESNNCLNGGAGWSRSSNYTMTVSVIVPLVISVFLLVILCVLFFLIRRCHNARAQEMDRDAGIIPTISGGIGRRRRQRNRQAQRPADFPPTYEEALESPPYEEPPLGCENGMLKPPTYHEAIGQVIGEPPVDGHAEEDYPPPEFSTIDRSQRNSSSMPNANSDDIRPVNHTHSMSYSSESSTEIPLGRNVSHGHSPNYSEVPHQRVRGLPSEEREDEYRERPSSQLEGQEDRRSCPPPPRPKSNIRRELERKLQEDQINPANTRRNLNADNSGQMSVGKGNTNYRDRQRFPDSPSRHGSSSLHSKEADSNKGKQHWREENKRRPKDDWRNRTSDSSSKGLLSDEDHYTEGENKGVLNQAFKDFDRNSKHSPPRTNSASLANLPSSLDKWTDERRGGMAMSLQHLPTTHCVASNNIQAAGSAQELPRRTSTAIQPITNSSQHLQPSDRPMSLSVGHLPTRSQEQPLSTGENRRERERPSDTQRSVSLGDLNRRLQSQTTRRQTHSHADLSNIQEERGADSIVFACESEDVFV